MNIFETNSYKTFLKAVLNNGIKEGQKLNLSQMAHYCNVQRTYLSKVLNHNANFNSDQLFLACNYLSMNKTQKDFAFHLFEAEKTVIQERKNYFLEEANKIRVNHNSTESHINSKSICLSENDLSVFMDPIAQIINLMLMIQKYQDTPTLIKEVLGLSEAHFDSKIEILSNAGYIKLDGNNKWYVAKDNIHLSKKSNMYPTYAVMQRMAYIEKIRHGLKNEDYSFSVLFTANERSREQIQEKIFNLIKEIEAIVRIAPSESVYQINLDFGCWT